MKKYFFAFILITLCIHAKAQYVIIPDSIVVMTFDSTTAHLGTFVEGAVIECEFHFRNTGKAPLAVHGGRTSDCVSYPLLPIAPNETGVIKFRMSPYTHTGPFNELFTVASNNRDGEITFHVIGNIIPLPPNAAILYFDSTSFHFGKVTQGTIVTTEFHFINAGKTPLRISDCAVSTSNAVVEFPHDSIPPGGTGVIKYRYNTIGKMGLQEKAVTVFYGDNQTIVLPVYGEVIAK